MSNRVVPLFVMILAGLAVDSTSIASAQEKVRLPGEQPVFFIVTSVNDDGFVIERNPPPTKLVDVPRIVYKPSFKTLQATDAKGSKLSAADFSKRVKRGSIVLVSANEEPVDPVLLSVVKDDTVILLDIFPRKGATGANVGE